MLLRRLIAAPLQSWRPKSRFVINYKRARTQIRRISHAQSGSFRASRAKQATQAPARENGSKRNHCQSREDIMRISKSQAGMLVAVPVALGCLALIVGASNSRSQEGAAAPPAGPFQYAAKFVCGIAPGGTANPGIVAPGKYFTAINVHNPNATPTIVQFKKLFVIALPSEKQGGTISNSFPAALKAQEAWEIECGDIVKHLGFTGSFVKGFVMLFTPVELDVVAVYTAASSTTGPVVSMALERVPKR
jgi:hypothetical protein